MHMSMLPSKPTYPMLPPYISRLHGSSSSIISIALTFGAPVSVPAGKHAFRQSNASMPFFICPVTFDTMYMTCEYLSIDMSPSTVIVPGSATLPTSFLPRSTSIMCSARSLGSATSSFARPSSSDSSLPLLRVPAMGFTLIRPSSTFTSISGEEPANVVSPSLRKNMYGEGLITRRARYMSNGAALSAVENLCDSTVWMMSPAEMYCLMRSTASINDPLLKLEVISLLPRRSGAKGSIAAFFLSVSTTAFIFATAAS